MCYREFSTSLDACVCPSDFSLGSMINVSGIPFKRTDSPKLGVFVFCFPPGTEWLSLTPFKPLAIGIKNRVVGVRRLRI